MKLVQKMSLSIGMMMPLSRLKYDLAPDEAFLEYPEWRAKETTALAENGAAFMSILSSSPALLKGVKSRKNRQLPKSSW